jgi:hypothetical protein
MCLAAFMLSVPLGAIVEKLLEDILTQIIQDQADDADDPQGSMVSTAQPTPKTDDILAVEGTDLPPAA